MTQKTYLFTLFEIISQVMHSEKNLIYKIKKGVEYNKLWTVKKMVSSIIDVCL